MGNFFEDIFGQMFGSSPEKRRLEWADQGPTTTKNFGEANVAAYWQAILEQEQQNRDRFALYEEQHGKEIGRINSAQVTLKERLASMKENLAGQRDSMYGDIQEMFTEQGETISDTHDAARGSVETEMWRRGFGGTTVAKDREDSLTAREDTSNRKNSEWRGSQRDKANSVYTNAVAQADTTFGQQIAGLEAQKGQADRALTSFKENLYRQFPVQMSAVPQMQLDNARALYGTDWEGMEITTKAGQAGQVQDQLSSMFTGMISGGVNAAIGGVGSMFSGMGGQPNFTGIGGMGSSPMGPSYSGEANVYSNYQPIMDGVFSPINYGSGSNPYGNQNNYGGQSGY